GPLVLAGDHGPRREGRAAIAAAPPIPVLVAAGKPITEWGVPTGSRAGDFKAAQIARIPSQPRAPGDVARAPVFPTQASTHSVYFDVLTQAEFDARAAAATAEREHQRRVEAATISYIRPGDATPEKEYNYQSDPADRRAERTEGRSSRGGQGWFSFDLPVDP